MDNLQIHQAICRQFSALLSYPDTEVQTTATACQQLLQECYPDSARKMQDFIEYLSATDRAQSEEVFTATFDLQPLCYPYVGYQLCGENEKRAMFLMKVQQLYHQYDFNQGAELPDHLGEMLRFVGTTADRGCRQELIDDGLLPALEKIIAGIDNEDHPYQGLLKSLYSFLNKSNAEKGALS